MGTDETRSLVDFKWGDESVVIKQVDAVAVYTNTEGDLVIRQRDALGNEDALIIVPMQRTGELIEAIKRETKASKG